MLNRGLVSAPAVAAAHRAGYRVFVWTVDDLATMQRIAAMGVDGIASNRPDLFYQLKQHTPERAR